MTGQSHRLLFSLSIILLLTACDSITLPSRDDNQGGGTVDSAAEQYYQEGLDHTSASGVPQDYSKAAQAFKKAARSGHTDAQYMLGIAFSVGRGVDKDPSEAVSWFEKAGINGHPRAQYQLGEAYMNGRGALKDRAWGAHWYGMSAYQGHTQAQLSLAVAFIKGLGLPKSDKNAAFWLQLASLGGDDTALKLLQKIQPTIEIETYQSTIISAGSWRPKKMSGYNNSPTVRYLQHTLTKLGYQPGYADGIIGSRTKNAVGRFLEKNGHANDLTIKEVIHLMRDRSPGL